VKRCRNRPDGLFDTPPFVSECRKAFRFRLHDHGSPRIDFVLAHLDDSFSDASARVADAIATACAGQGSVARYSLDLRLSRRRRWRSAVSPRRVEIIHALLVVHDISCMDDDDMRRGVHTHKRRSAHRDDRGP